MALLGTIKQSWLPGGGGHQIARGVVALVSGTAAVGIPFQTVESAVATSWTGTATPGTASYSIGLTAGTASGVAASSGYVVVRSNDLTDTGQVSVHITGF